MKALLAVDLRHEADNVVLGGLDWAKRLGATLDVAYVDEFRTSRPVVDEPHLQSVLELEWNRMQREDEAELTRLLGLLPAEIRGGFRLTAGAAAAGLVALAPEYDLLVVATHARKGLAHFWLGSVAERVVRTSPRPVLVLRLG